MRQTRLVRATGTVTWAALAGLAIALIAGCGSSGIPTDASVKDFCKAGSSFANATKFSEGVKAAKQLHDTGTPKGIPANARQGFEVVVSLVTDSKDKADLQKSYEKLTTKDKAAVEALDTYIRKTC
jgi:hypothetical protein